MRKYKWNKIVKFIKEVTKIDIEKCRDLFADSERNFTRKRKQPLDVLLRTLLMNYGSTLNQQLRLTQGIGDDRASAAALIQQKRKLTQEFYDFFFRSILGHIKDLTPYKGKYLVVAGDGSDVNIHPDPTDDKTKLKLSNNPHDKVCNQLHLNAFVAVPDGVFLEYEIQDHKDKDEDEAAILMAERLSAKSTNKRIPIITLDRGYESYRLMMKLDSLGYKYCIRVKDSWSNGIASRYKHLCGEDGCFDEIITTRFTRNCWVVHDKSFDNSGYTYVPPNSRNEFIPKPENNVGRTKKNEERKLSYVEFTFRMTRIKLSDDSYEVLVSNLPKDEFSAQDLKDLYHLRWVIETSFRQLKYDDCASFLHSKKKQYAIGELIMSMVFHNICSIVLMALAEELQARMEARRRCYAYKVSYSDLAGTMKIYLQGRDPPLKVENLVRELERTMEPVRDNRKFERILKTRQFISFFYRAA